MTDHEMIEYLAGELGVLKAFCGALAQNQKRAGMLGPSFFESCQQSTSLLEHYSPSDSFLAGLRQAQKELDVFLQPDSTQA